MSDVLASQVLLPSYYLRVKTKYGNVFKRESGLINKTEEGALSEIKQIFDKKDFKDNWEIYYLVKISWGNSSINRGANTIEEEALLEIIKKRPYDWSVKRNGDFIEVSRLL